MSRERRAESEITLTITIISDRLLSSRRQQNDENRRKKGNRLSNLTSHIASGETERSESERERDREGGGEME